MCSPSACGPCSVAKLVKWRAQIAQGEACDLYIVDGAASAVGTDFGSRTPQPPSLLGQADCCVGQAIRHLGRESPFRSEICHSNPSRLCTRRFRHAAVGESPAAGTTFATVPLEEHDRIYFQSYSHIGIHEAMIKDRVRTDAYHTAIMYHQKFIEGKVVLDVGCGTGILSVFCARAGAKRVYAVEASEIATQACEIVKANNLADQIVVIHGRVEDVDLEEKVDVIISEWMGYMLLYESMLPSVLFARDKWLKPGGLILPSHATLFMAPITNSERYEGSVDFWCDVYGINMSALVPLAKKFTYEEPSIEIIGGENVISWPSVVKHIDCYNFTAEEFKSITAKYKVSSMMLAPIHGFGFWFEVEFNGPAESSQNVPSNLNPLEIIQKKRRRSSEDTVLLSTAPEDEPTHWQQTILYFPDPMEVKQDRTVEGSVTVSQSTENPRFLNIHLECSTGGQTLVKDCYAMNS